MRATIDGMLWLSPQSEADSDVIDQLCGRMTYPNPVFVRAKQQGTKTRGLDPTLEFFEYVEQDEDGNPLYGLPRAVVRGENYESVADRWDWVDERLYLSPRDELAAIRPIGLRDYQIPAVDEVEGALRDLPEHGAVLHAPCGTGKTVMGLELVRRLGVPTAVLVHKTFLVEQWEERIHEFLPGARVGFLRQDRVDSPQDHDIIICMVQSLLARKYPKDFFDQIGFVVSDEVHRLAAPTWHRSIAQFKAAYRLGLTATPRRADGLHAVFKAGIGDIAYEVEGTRLRAKLGVVRTTTRIPPERYVQKWNRKPNLSKLVTALTKDEKRTKRILDDVRRAVQAGRKCLVLTDRVDHVNVIVKALCVTNVHAKRFVGGMKPEEQEAALEADVVVGTFAMAQEGLDCPALDTLFLATPKRDVTQAVGRILREREGKKDPLVVDYYDQAIPICSGMFTSRGRIYAELGIERQQPKER